MNQEDIDREQLARRHTEAKVAEDIATDKEEGLSKDIRRIERDIDDRQKWLKAFRGDDPRLRDALIDNPDFLRYDSVAAEKEIHTLYCKLRDKRFEREQARKELAKAISLEKEAFYALHQFSHRQAVVQALELEVKLFQPLRAEALARKAVAERERLTFGSLPNCARVDFAQFDITNGQSGICHRIREAVKLGYLSGEEPWLEGVRWQQDAPQGIRYLDSRG